MAGTRRFYPAGPGPGIFLARPFNREEVLRVYIKLNKIKILFNLREGKNTFSQLKLFQTRFQLSGLFQDSLTLVGAGPAAFQYLQRNHVRLPY